MDVGDVMGAAGGTEVFRVKLMVPGMGPVVGVTVKAPGGTPAVDTVAVKVPEPDTDAVPVWPHPTVSVNGETAIVGATGAGGASPAGLSAPTTSDDSTTRLSRSVTMSALDPQPLCATRKLPPLVVTMDGVTDKNCGNGDTTV